MEWKKPAGGGKYGLQLKIAAPAAKRPQLKKPLPFSVDDRDTHEDEYNVEDDIARQATKKQSNREVEMQLKEALEQDASVFDYDGVYDEMKGKQAQPIREDRAKREPKYIGKLLQQAKIRAVEHDIAFERNLAKERAKEDHLFPDKEKFVTKAYKQKLIEQGKWLEEERLKEIKEQAEEVSKKGDLGDFYRNLLTKNVAYGANEIQVKKSSEGNTQLERVTSSQSAELETTGRDTSEEDREIQDVRKHRNRDDESGLTHAGSSEGVKPRGYDQGVEERDGIDVATVTAGSTASVSGAIPAKEDAQNISAPAEDRKSKEEAVLAAKERYLARKKQRQR